MSSPQAPTTAIPQGTPVAGSFEGTTGQPAGATAPKPKQAPQKPTDPFAKMGPPPAGQEWVITQAGIQSRPIAGAPPTPAHGYKAEPPRDTAHTEEKPSSAKRPWSIVLSVLAVIILFAILVPLLFKGNAAEVSDKSDTREIGLSAADHISINKAEVEKAEQLEKLAAAKAERDAKAAEAEAVRIEAAKEANAARAAKAAEMDLERLRIAAEKEIKLAELKTQADAAKLSRAERLEELKAAERAKNQSLSAQQPSPMPQVAAGGYRPPLHQGTREEMVLIDGVLAPKSALSPNAIHCAEGRCDAPVAKHQGCECGRCGGGNQCNGNTNTWNFLNDLFDVNVYFGGGGVIQKPNCSRIRGHRMRPSCLPRGNSDPNNRRRNHR